MPSEIPITTSHLVSRRFRLRENLALALLLSLVGLYGVMSFVVTRRTREIGIRLALGATRASALRLVLRDAVTMIAAGVALALPCVAALGSLHPRVASLEREPYGRPPAGIAPIAASIQEDNAAADAAADILARPFAFSVRALRVAFALLLLILVVVQLSEVQSLRARLELSQPIPQPR